MSQIRQHIGQYMEQNRLADMKNLTSNRINQMRGLR